MAQYARHVAQALEDLRAHFKGTLPMSNRIGIGNVYCIGFDVLSSCSGFRHTRFVNIEDSNCCASCGEPTRPRLTHTAAATCDHCNLTRKRHQSSLKP